MDGRLIDGERTFVGQSQSIQKFHFPEFLIVVLDKDGGTVVGEVDDVVQAAAVGAGGLELHGDSELLPQSGQLFQQGVLADWYI